MREEGADEAGKGMADDTLREGEGEGGATNPVAIISSIFCRSWAMSEWD